MFVGRLLKSIDDYQRFATNRSLYGRFRRKAARAQHLLWSVLTHSDIDPKARLSRDVKLPHPNGIVIHGDAVIGSGCMIMQQVTIGMIDSGEVPTIGRGVYLGAGAKILGRVNIGDNARIGANAVVLVDVPANHTAVGIPARLIRREAELDLTEATETGGKAGERA